MNETICAVIVRDDDGEPESYVLDHGNNQYQAIYGEEVIGKFATCNEAIRALWDRDRLEFFDLGGVTEH